MTDLITVKTVFGFENENYKERVLQQKNFNASECFIKSETLQKRNLGITWK